MQHLFSQIQGRSVLITGGAGYIGRITHALFEQAGATVWVLDNFSGGQHPLRTKRFLQLDLLDSSSLQQVFTEHAFDIVIHLAGKIDVGESVRRPDFYWEQNVLGTQNLLNAMHGYSKNIIFASSAAVYGEHAYPVTERTSCHPTSPYGQGKLEGEHLIAKHSPSSIIFRLFNVAGAIPHPESVKQTLGEDHQPETHLIPRIIQQHLQGQSFSIYGNQYPTPDGTCIREYIHVYDVARAFLYGANQLLSKYPSQYQRTYNLSSGIAHSVLEVIQQLSNLSLQYSYGPIHYTIDNARHGDPSHITSSISTIEQALNWTPVHSSLQNILKTAWQHQLNHLDKA